MTEHGWPDEHGDVDPHSVDPHSVDPHSVDPHDGDVSHHDAVPDPGWTEHGWPDQTGHGDEHGYDDPTYEPLGLHDAEPADWAAHAQPGSWEPLSHLHDTATPHDHAVADVAHDTGPDTGHPGAGGEADPAYAMGHVGADPDAVADLAASHDLFPPPVDVGPLPEPVDGFPWIDPVSLGVDPVSASAVSPEHAEVPPAPGELAAYAGVDVSDDDGDAWQRLAAADDPATGALARFWQPPD